MKPLRLFATLFILTASCVGPIAGRSGAAAVIPPSQEQKTQGDGDVIYTAPQVDTKAMIINKMENIPVAGSDCPRAGIVRLRLVLHKSGKVTEVTLIKGMGCSYDDATVAVARKFKFIPAVKEHQQVSQYQIFEYRTGDQ